MLGPLQNNGGATLTMALLPVKVQLTIVAGVAEKMPPPSPAELPLNVLLTTLHPPLGAKIAPPLNCVKFPLNVLVATVHVPPVKMAPPLAAPVTELPTNLQSVTVRLLPGPPAMAPPPVPLFTELLTKRQFVTDTVPWLTIAAPSGANPFAKLRPEMATVAAGEILNTRDELLPLSVKTSCPGPTIVIFWPMDISPEFSEMVVGSPKLNMTVSPGAAALMVSLKDPRPLSLVFETNNTAKAFAGLVHTAEFSIPIAAVTAAKNTASSFTIRDRFIFPPSDLSPSGDSGFSRADLKIGAAEKASALVSVRAVQGRARLPLLTKGASNRFQGPDQQRSAQ